MGFIRTHIVNSTKSSKEKTNKQEVQQIEIIKNQTGILAPKNTINGMRNVESFKS